MARRPSPRKGSSRRRTRFAREPRAQAPPRQAGKATDDCSVPEPLTPEAAAAVAVKASPIIEMNEIRAYMAAECADETVTFLERVTSEHVFGRRLDVWDVHTNKGRYWVITEPTNLYSHRLFPSLDFTLTVHVGLAARVTARRDGPPDLERAQRLAECWRRWGQAAEAADQAEEAEAFQAAGVRCRELLLTLIRELARDWMVPEGEEPPKAADFVHWSERVAEGLAEGASADRIRGNLKAEAKATWEMVQWLTHTKNATRFDAELVLEATRATLAAFGTALLRSERAFPDPCRRCSSYRVVPYEPPMWIVGVMHRLSGMDHSTTAPLSNRRPASSPPPRPDAASGMTEDRTPQMAAEATQHSQ